MQEKESRVVIVAVLNWGLGHATRMVPVIDALQSHGFTPVLFSDGVALRYLKTHFPNLVALEAPGYQISYRGNSFLLNILGQLPKVMRAARKENQYLKQVASKLEVVGVISDNRLGAYHRQIPSLYVTHQVNIKAGFFSGAASLAHRWFMRKFNQLLIPDVKNRELSIAGQLSHSFDVSIPFYFLGLLSRYSGEAEKTKKKYDACIILSGPEPARSQWETLIIQQVRHLKNMQFLLIRGKHEPTGQANPENLTLLNLANETEILEGILQSEVVVSRSGYSSLMDYACLQNKALLVPTPGQTEQEYLAQRHQDKFAVQDQSVFNLEKGIEEAKEKTGFKNLNKQQPTDWAALFSLFEGK